MAASKQPVTLGDEASKQLKTLVGQLITDDEDIRQAVKALVLAQIHDNPGAIQRAVAHAIDEALTYRWSGEKKELTEEVVNGIRTVADEVIASARKAAKAEMYRQIRRLKGEPALDPVELAQFILDNPRAARGAGTVEHDLWTQQQTQAKRIVDDAARAATPEQIA